MSTSYDIFNSLLPLFVTERLRSDVTSGTQKAAIEGLPSYFNVRVSEGGLLSSGDLSYDGWCLDTNRNISLRTYTNVAVYSTYGIIPSTVLQGGEVQPVDPPDITLDANGDTYLDSLQKVNWIFNNIAISENVIQDGDFVYQYTDPLTSTTYKFTQGDVQRAIWDLTGSDPDTPSSLLGPSTDANVTTIVNLATTNGRDFLAEAGDYIGVILDPGNNRQPAIIQVRTAGVGDTVFFDSNDNGIADEGEGLKGVTVKLLADKGDGNGFQVVGTTITGDNPHTPEVEDGYYFFGPLLAGPDGGPGITYQVMVDTTTLPGGGLGWVNTVDPDGGDANMSEVTLLPGDVNLDQDFGYLALDFGDAPDSYGTTLAFDGARHVLSIGQTANTPLLKLGSTVDVELNGQPSTGADGDDLNLLFGGPVPPAPDDEDGVTLPASVAAGETFTVSISVMEDSANVDGRLSAWIDWNRDGDFEDAGEQIAADVAVVNGGNSLIVTAPVDAVSGLTYARFRLSSDRGLSPTGEASDGEVEDYTITIRGQQPTASLGNFVWEDLNANGRQDAGEPGVSGVLVTLTGGGADGVIGTPDDTTATATTNAGGFYQFISLNPGEEYKVTFTRPAAFISFTRPNAIPPADDTNDSDADPVSGMSQIVTLAPGENNDTIDAGLLRPATIGDFVWRDANGNGVQDPGEAGVPNVTVTLTGTDALGNPVTRTTTTNGNGLYLFNGNTLLPGTYKVTFSDLPDGLAFTAPNQGNDDSRDSDADPANGMTPFVTVGSGGINLTLDAGLVGTGIDIIKFVNGDDANSPTGPILTVGSIATFTYEVRNTGNVSLANVTVSDDNGTSAIPGDDFNPSFTGGDTNNNNLLDLGETWTYSATSTVQAGQYTNIATTTGTPVYPPGTDQPGTPVPGLDPPTDTDPANYFGQATASLGNFVWEDLNANGRQDAGEPGVSGVLVTLTGGGADGVIGTPDDTTATTTTNAGGFYQFINLNPGEEYKVTFQKPAAFISFTRPNAIPPADDTNDSDADPVSGMSQIVTLAPGENNDTIDAGLLRPATIGDFVWRDANGNGVQDPGEAGVPNVTVTLTGTDALGNPVTRTTTTNGNGLYLFNGNTLLPGTYKVTFSGLPDGLAFTAPNQGNDDSRDSDADPANGMTQFVTVGSGGINLTLDAGLVGTGIDIIKFVNGDDANSPTGPILTVGSIATFTYEVRNTGNVSLANVTVSDDNGTSAIPGDDFNPSFTGGDTNNNNLLDLGETWTYSATSTVQAGQYTNIATTTGTPVYPPGTDQPGTPVPGLDPPTDTDPANYFGQATASLGNFVWEDLNANGRQDAGEPGVSGVLVTLTGGGADGVIGTPDDTTATATTNAGGFYQFINLNPGEEYKVTFQKPAAFISFTRPNAIPPADDTNDSDADPVSGMSQIVTLAPGENNDTIDAGLLRPATIGDFVWRDANGNGVQDPGEAGVPNVTVTLTGTDALGNPVTRTTTTNGNGLYLFNGNTLLPGTYKVTFSGLPDGLAFTAPNQGNDDSRDSDADPANGMTPFVTVGSGGINLTLDAGLVGTGIDIIKFVNGDDANSPTGPILTVGSIATFTYEVRNTGNVSLANVTVSDDNGTSAIPGDDFNPSFTGGDTNNNNLLDLGETWTYSATSTVQAGQYTNIATTTGTPVYPPGTDQPGTPVPGLDSSHRYRSRQLLRSGNSRHRGLRLE